MTAVAILGARGQIARGLLEHLPSSWDIQPFSRDPGALHPEARARGAALLPYDCFARGDYELVVNAAGPGDPGAHRALGPKIFQITETFDNLALDYLATRPSAAYINVSTGAVANAAADTAKPYVVAKRDAEAKHRLRADSRIADLRVFGYFSRHIDLQSGFFMAQLIRCLVRNETFVTPAADFARDYVAPEDLAGYMVALAERGVPNGAYDAVSREPATKFTILEAMRKYFGLRYEIDRENPTSPERPKHVTPQRNWPNFPFAAKLTSLQVVMRESEALVRNHGARLQVTLDGHD
ncbi:MAG TPA: NAD-dependent epimerase/dehydratase family protein [Stellaceae bacterium]|nr:NAD-dependent epimerase/dehydratase family protein [Stellaceae bacterium]